MTAAAAAAPKGAHSCLLYLVDVASSKRYLVDSGSAFSILPHKSSAEPTGPHMMTADGKPLTCWGRCMCTVRTRTMEFLWTFLLAPVAFPILGADFLSNFRLLVHISNKRLVAHWGKLIQLEQGKQTKAAVVTGVVAAALPPAVAPSSPSPHTVEALPSTPSLPTVEALSRGSSGPPAGSRHARGAKKPKAVVKLAVVAVALPTAVPPSSPSLPTEKSPGSDSSGQHAAFRHVGAAKNLRLKYKAVVGASKRFPPVKHTVEHLTETTATRPVASRYRQLDPKRLATAKAEFATMGSQGIIRLSKSSWSSPLHMVEKSDGTWQPCSDYR